MGMDICLLANEIDGIFALSCALCADHIIFPEVIHTLAAVDRMVICGSQGIGDILLVSDAVPAVLWLAVYGISRNADHRFLLHQRYIIAARPIAGRHGGRYLLHLSVAAVNTVVFIHQRLMAVLLRPQCTRHILRNFHDLTTLIVDAQHRRHTVATGACLQCWSNAFVVSDAPGTGSGTCRKTGDKCLLFYSRLCI